MSLVNAIANKYYFIDYIGINIHVPFKKLSSFHKERGYDFIKELHEWLINHFKDKSKNFEKDWMSDDSKINYPGWYNDMELNNVYNHMTNKGVVIRDRFDNIQINFKGAYFRKTDNIKDDFNNWFKNDWERIYERIFYLYYSHKVECDCGDLLPSQKHLCVDPKITIFRLDIANNIPTFFNNNWKDICKPSDKVNFYTSKLNNIPLITGLTIGERTTKNIYFRAYDKTIPNKLNKKSRAECVARFGDTDLIRREWELKSRFLQANQIHTPEALLQVINVSTSLSIIIKKFRKSKDLVFLKRPKEFGFRKIFKNRKCKQDTYIYKSIHDGTELQIVNRSNILNGATYMNIKQLKKAEREKAKLFIHSHRSNNYKTIEYDPFPQQLGLSKYNQNLSWDKHLELMRLQVLAMRKANNIKPLPEKTHDEIYEQFLIDIGYEIEQFQKYCLDIGLNVNIKKSIIPDYKQFEYYKDDNQKPYKAKLTKINNKFKFVGFRSKQ